MKQHHGDFYNKTNFWQFDRWEDLIGLAKSTPLDLAGVKTWLDIGCGSGKQTKELMTVFEGSELGVGIDVSQTMLETAKAENSHPKLTYMELGAERVGELTQNFDVVHSNFVLHWVEDKDAVFQGLDKVTHKGSYFVLGTCQALPNLLMDIDVFMRQEFEVAAEAKSPFHYLDLRGWVNLLHKYGWRIEAASVKHDNHYTGDAQEFLEHWVTASSQKICYGHGYNELTSARKKALLTMALEKYAFQNERSFLFQEETLLLVARKL